MIELAGGRLGLPSP